MVGCGGPSRTPGREVQPTRLISVIGRAGLAEDASSGINPRTKSDRFRTGASKGGPTV